MSLPPGACACCVRSCLVSLCPFPCRLSLPLASPPRTPVPATSRYGLLRTHAPSVHRWSSPDHTSRCTRGAAAQCTRRIDASRSRGEGWVGGWVGWGGSGTHPGGREEGSVAHHTDPSGGVVCAQSSWSCSCQREAAQRRIVVRTGVGGGSGVGVCALSSDKRTTARQHEGRREHSERRDGDTNMTSE